MWVTRPETMRRSACRGEDEKRSIPKRAMSYRDETIDIISIAQHASPNVSGHTELERAQATAFSIVVRSSASSSSATSRSNTPGPRSGQSTRSDWRPAFASGRSLTRGRLRFSAS